MKNWFEITVKYNRLDDEGKEVRVSEAYLLDAESFTEAEARITKEMSEMIRGAFLIDKITKTRIIEIFGCGFTYWKAKISMVTVDERAGKIKKINDFYLVSADNIEQALIKLRTNVEYITIPYEIESMVMSNIVEVFPYF